MALTSLSNCEPGLHQSAPLPDLFSAILPKVPSFYLPSSKLLLDPCLWLKNLLTHEPCFGLWLSSWSSSLAKSWAWGDSQVGSPVCRDNEGSKGEANEIIPNNAFGSSLITHDVISQNHRITTLEETFKVIKSNHPPSTAPATPKPQHPVPDPDVSWTPPGMWLHHIHGQPILMPDYPNSETFVLMFNLNFPSLSLRSFPLLLSL